MNLIESPGCFVFLSGADFIVEGVDYVGPSTYTQEIIFDGVTIKKTGSNWMEWMEALTEFYTLPRTTSYGESQSGYAKFDGYYVPTNLARMHRLGRLYSKISIT